LDTVPLPAFFSAEVSTFPVGFQPGPDSFLPEPYQSFQRLNAFRSIDSRAIDGGA
jgi:hypothetical protein